MTALQETAEPPLASPSRDDDWAGQTRSVLTRDVLLRAAHARPGEARALEFRALHLNLALIGVVADRLGLTEAQRARAEHDALEGLHEAVRRFDPCGLPDFEEYAAAVVERRLRAQLHRPALRVAAHRVAQAIARV